MREIKFRARRIDNWCWVYGQYFKTLLTDENSGTTPDAGWFFLSGEPRDCIVQDHVSFVIDAKTRGQYTGLKDKNGVEIYEGDIVEIRSEIVERGRIVFDEEHGQFAWQEPVSGVFYGLTTCDGSNEVVGNIYENPELIGRDVK